MKLKKKIYIYIYIYIYILKVKKQCYVKKLNYLGNRALMAMPDIT